MLYRGDCLRILPTLPMEVDAVLTDPPYELGFMGKKWDSTGIAFQSATWQATMRVLKPGGYLLAFGGSRTYHRMTCAIEDAGFEIRDCILWLYGTGFPKGKGCLKPGYEPIVLARRPGKKVLPLGIDECRISGADTRRVKSGGRNDFPHEDDSWTPRDVVVGSANGRYPANVCHDGSEEVLEAFAEFGEKGDGHGKPRNRKVKEDRSQYRIGGAHFNDTSTYSDSGTAARFYYTAKASRSERGEGNNHPTVKPLSLTRWLTRLICPPGGTVLDPFAGSGTTGVACLYEGRESVLIEQNPDYCNIILSRLRVAKSVLTK